MNALFVKNSNLGQWVFGPPNKSLGYILADMVGFIYP